MKKHLIAIIVAIVAVVAVKNTQAYTYSQTYYPTSYTQAYSAYNTYAPTYAPTYNSYAYPTTSYVCTNPGYACTAPTYNNFGTNININVQNNTYKKVFNRNNCFRQNIHTYRNRFDRYDRNWGDCARPCYRNQAAYRRRNREVHEYNERHVYENSVRRNRRAGRFFR